LKFQKCGDGGRTDIGA